MGQSIDNRAVIKIKNDNCIFNLPHKYILISSLKVNANGQFLNNETFTVSNGQLILNDSACRQYIQDTLTICYRKMPFDLDKKFALLDTTRMKKRDVAIYIGYDLTPDAISASNKIIDSKTLDYNGSFSRGFSVGNAQSLVVNSKFDMQLQGEIGNGIAINAAISDDNIPIQAEGNTQVLQEFDKVFIELSKDATKVLAGDFVIERPNSYFVNYLKKLKGIGIRNSYQKNDRVLSTAANIATSRGKFSRQTIIIKEGNQGPYKLAGNNNERYIIVLSGTEKIYFNGLLLKRGQEYDYTIDYNTSEIIFSPNRLITRETRIIAEFEYTDQNYYRTLYNATSQYNYGNSTFTFNYYSEQDSKKSTGQLELDSNSIEILKQVGDNSNGYSVSSIRAASEEDLTSIKYELIANPDYPADKNEYYLQFSINPNALLYTSFFSETAQNNGSYIIDPSKSLNGRVYKFVGENKGNYEPINKLVPPEQKQMMDFGYTYNFKNSGKLVTDFSLSNYDKNRFSAINDEDNIGLAAFVSIENKNKIHKTKTDSLSIVYGLSFENTGSEFKPLNQYRNAEFIRDWNYLPSKANNEKILRGQLGLANAHSKILFKYNMFKAGNDFDGTNIGIGVDYMYKKFSLTALPSYTKSKSSFLDTKFLRPNFIVAQTIPFLNNLVVGFELEAEYNEKTKIASNLLDSTSYSFYYTKSYISIGERDDIGLRISYNKRQDNFASLSSIDKAIKINELEINGKWLKSEFSSINASLKIRDYNVVNASLAKNEKSKLTLLGNIDHSLSILRKSIMATTNYIVNSGQEPKIEFVFQKVENLRGDYVYVGTDTASVKNVNDFRYDPSNPLSSYVKFILPNNEFTTTNNISLNHTIRIEPAKYWIGDTTKLNTTKNIIGRFTNATLARLSNKSASGTANFNYFNFSTQDSSLVSFTKSIVSTTMFNRGNARYDVSFIYRNNGSKSNQINGFESRISTEYEWRTRINFITNTDFFLTYIAGVKSFENKLFKDRNFIIDVKRYTAEISYRPNTKMRLNGKYGRIVNEQTINNKEQATKNEYTVTFNKRSSNTSALDLSFSYVDVAYDGLKTSLIQYDILESLQPGSNYLWAVNYTRRLSKFIDLTFTYEGRKTGISPIVNVGRIQAKATF